MENTIQLPQVYQKDIQRAASILKEAGCTQVFLFGSVATGKVRDGSDLDLAVRGCPPDKFFHLLGRLLMTLDHPVDLVDLDVDDPFARYLERKGRLIPVD